MDLWIQPDAGVKPLVDAIDQAQERVEVVIFRFDRTELEKALMRAVARGVFVHASIAYTNRGGEKNLRLLEMRLLEHGITVARSADDLVRYHGKMIIIDRRTLYVLGFNLTYLDMEHSRSFGIATKDKKLLQEAVKLFEADTTRQAYTAGLPEFVVSPVNARKEISAFIKGAKKELLIYDPKVSDPRMLRLLEDQAKAGVKIRILGKLEGKSKLASRELGPMRLHSRTMVRDGEDVFNGSQSLRAAELETRREIGVIFSDAKIAKQITAIFEDDWAHSEEREGEASAMPVQKAARKVAKAVTKSLAPVAPVLEGLAKEALGPVADLEVDTAKLEEAVRVAVKLAVEKSVRDAVQEAVEQQGEPAS